MPYDQVEFVTDVRRDFVALRRKLGLTQQQAALALGIDREHLRDLETGRRPVYRMHVMAMELLRMEAAGVRSDLVSARMLRTAQAICRGVGYDVVLRPAERA